MSGITLARPLQLEGKPVTRVENYCATGSEALRQAAYAVASGAYDIAMAVGAEKVKDSGYAGLNAFPIPNDGTAPHAHRGGDVQHGRAGVRQEVRRRRGRDQGRARPHRVEEPLQRRPQPARAVPARDEHRDDLRVAAGRRSARHPRLRGRGRRRRGRDRRAGRGRAPLHRQARSTSRRCRSSPATARGSSTPTYDYTHFPEVERSARGRVRAGRHHRSAPRARDGRGARLLHADRARAHGGPRVRRAGHGVEGGARRARSTSTASCR